MPFSFRTTWIVMTTALVCFIVTSEFVIDITQYEIWSDLVVGADFVLLALFTLRLLVDGWRSEYGLLSTMKKNQLDFFLISGCWLLSFDGPRAASALIIVRLTFKAAAWALKESSDQSADILSRARPSHILGLSFLALIAFGSILLMFPAATVDGQGLSFTDAIFTITSAACVTGLVVVSTAEHFTFFGHLVILFCIQVGGIEIMVLSAAFLSKVGGFLPSRQTASLGAMVDEKSTAGVTRLVTTVTSTTIIVETVGALLLWLLWGMDSLTLPEKYDSITGALWWCIFHAISGFCQGGFSLAPDSMSAFVGHLPLNLIFITITTIAGLGFVTVWELGQITREQLKRPMHLWTQLDLQTRVILVWTIVMNAVGVLLFIFFEYHQTLRGLDMIDKITASTFQVVNMRSTGLNTLPMSDVTLPTSIFSCIWMFIGSAPGSTGGGIRITTAVLVILSVRAVLLGRNEAELYGRTIRQNLMYRAMTIVMVSAALLAISTMALTATHDFPLEKALFEITSALGTVGLSMGVTPDLNLFGRWLIIVLMFVGRVGPLILAMALGEQKPPQRYRYPEGSITVG